MTFLSTPLFFPLAGKIPVADYESEGFKRLDLTTHCPIPLPGKGHPGAFGFERRNHIHEGVDLYGMEGDVALAIFGGTVAYIGPFTGPLAGSPWWLPTSAVAIEGPLGVAFHGEIDPFSFSVGQSVAAGVPLGLLARVLKNDKGRPTHMLHVELYETGRRESIGTWPVGFDRPKGLLDPTSLLLQSAGLSSRASALS